jgi:hypothetical protein
LKLVVAVVVAGEPAAPVELALAEQLQVEVALATAETELMAQVEVEVAVCIVHIPMLATADPGQFMYNMRLQVHSLPAAKSKLLATTALAM